MALASAALLGVVSTFSWSNVLNADNLKGIWTSCTRLHEPCAVRLSLFDFAAANVQQKQAIHHSSQEGFDADGSETDHSSTHDFAAAARREIQGLIRP